MRRRGSQVGGRALLALACSGAALGFAVPALATSLIHEERKQPAVRLLPAFKVPKSATQPPPVYNSEPKTISPASVPPPTGQLTSSQRHQVESTIKAPSPRVLVLPTVNRGEGPIATQAPPASTPPTSGHKVSTTKPTPVGPQGGTSAPSGAKR